MAPLHKKFLSSGLALTFLFLAALLPVTTDAAPPISVPVQPEQEILSSTKPVADILFFYGDG